MKTAINPGDYVEIIGGEWDGGRGTVETFYDDGCKIYLGSKEGEVKVYFHSETRLLFVDEKVTIHAPGVTLKRLPKQKPKGYFITDQGFSLTPGDEPNPEEVEVCKQWITMYATPRRAINQAWLSRQLRRAVTKWSNRPVGNGAFIKAAIELGYCYVQQKGNEKNAWFNMNFPARNSAQYSEAFSGGKL